MPLPLSCYLRVYVAQATCPFGGLSLQPLSSWRIWNMQYFGLSVYGSLRLRRVHAGTALLHPADYTWHTACCLVLSSLYGRSEPHQICHIRKQKGRVSVIVTRPAVSLGSLQGSHCYQLTEPCRHRQNPWRTASVLTGFWFIWTVVRVISLPCLFLFATHNPGNHHVIQSRLLSAAHQATRSGTA